MLSETQWLEDAFSLKNDPFAGDTLSETNIFAPTNRSGPNRKGESIPTIPFLGAKMLVSGRVCENFRGSILAVSPEF